MNFIFNFINLAAVEKTKRKKVIETVLYWHESEGNKKNIIEQNLFFFFPIFKNLGREGR